MINQGADLHLLYVHQNFPPSSGSIEPAFKVFRLSP